MQFFLNYLLDFHFNQTLIAPFRVHVGGSSYKICTNTWYTGLYLLQRESLWNQQVLWRRQQHAVSGAGSSLHVKRIISSTSPTYFYY